MIATFGLNQAGLAIVEEIALMVVSENWIPYETVPEKRLVDALGRLREMSVKGLRYDLQTEPTLCFRTGKSRSPSLSSRPVRTKRSTLRCRI
ncbi:Uncharacterized protein MLTONO_p0407 (plasmid) [Mesorhizobium loti]|nr:Uncharacterized protein MLTONO_p0407 [Mesorhizobium loti]